MKVVLYDESVYGSEYPAFGSIVDGDGSRYPGQTVPMPEASDLVGWGDYGLFGSVDASDVEDTDLQVISIILLVGDDEAQTNANRGEFARGTDTVSVRWLYADRACRIVYSDEDREIDLSLKQGWNRVLRTEAGDTYRHTVGNAPLGAAWSFDAAPTGPVFNA